MNNCYCGHPEESHKLVIDMGAMSPALGCFHDQCKGFVLNSQEKSKCNHPTDGIGVDGNRYCCSCSHPIPEKSYCEKNGHHYDGGNHPFGKREKSICITCCKEEPHPEPITRNSLLLADFVKYCTEHPEERFWQALRNWSEADYILWHDGSTTTEGNDTFYWENKNN